MTGRRKQPKKTHTKPIGIPPDPYQRKVFFANPTTDGGWIEMGDGARRRKCSIKP